ncbi:MAG: hypothetical protein HGA41_00595 [Syntrophaceae bacterium]|nr:hypothetical protein [Syntrophaceae bacterium]
MKKLIFIIVATALSLLFSIFDAHAQDKIRAVGMATIHKGAIDIARDKAIENAQRNAVEEKVGVMITSVSEIENYQVKLDQILSESKGFINSYKVISEKRQGKNYKVTIEADIGVGRLKDRMSAIDLIMLRKSKPRLMFLFSDRAQKDAIAEASMTKYFIAQGFKVIDADSVKKIKGVEELRSLTSDRTSIKKIAQSYGAEIVILCKVEVVTRSFKMGDVEISTNEVTVSGKVINGDTGEVIATDSKVRKGEVKLTAEEAATDLAKVVKEQILERWSSELTNVATVTLEVSGLKSYHELSRFKDLLSAEVKGVKQVFQRSYRDGEAELDIEIKGNTQGLADDIAAMTMNGKTIKIVNITQNKIEAKLVP